MVGCRNPNPRTWHMNQQDAGSVDVNRGGVCLQMDWWGWTDDDDGVRWEVRGESVVQNINSVATVISPYQRTTEVTNNIFQYCFCCFYMSPEPSRMNPFPKENFVIQNRGRMRFGCAIYNFSSAETKLWMTGHEKVKFELLSVTSIQRSKISGAFNKRDTPNLFAGAQ